MSENGGWQPIETAPNGVAVLIAYDDGDVVLYKAEDNDCDWRGSEGLEGIPGVSFPTHWMPLPEPPTS